MKTSEKESSGSVSKVLTAKVRSILRSNAASNCNLPSSRSCLQSRSRPQRELLFLAHFLRRTWRSCCRRGGRRLDKMKSRDDEIADPESQVASFKCHSPAAFNCRHISCNNLWRGGQFSVWLASYSLKPASSYRVILLSTGRTFIAFLYIASSSPHVFQPQTERSSTPFITLLFFRQCYPSQLWLQHVPVNMKNEIISYLNRALF